MCVYFCVFGSNIPRWRPALLIGKSFADSSSEPLRNSAGFADGRTVAVIQTRPSPSIIGLCTLDLLFQMISSPQYGDGPGFSCAAAGFVAGSRTVNGTRLVV